MTRKTQRGFSLVELMIVVSIIVVLGGLATPALLRAIRNYQLEAAGRNISNLILRARYEAMRRNQRVCTGLVTMASGENRYILNLQTTDPTGDPCNDANPVYDVGEDYIVTSVNVEWWQNGNPVPPPVWDGLPAGFNLPAEVNAPDAYQVTFSPRGTVEIWNGANYALVTQVQMFAIVRLSPELDAVLVTVTPYGRIKLYRWRVGANIWVKM